MAQTQHIIKGKAGETTPYSYLDKKEPLVIYLPNTDSTYYNPETAFEYAVNITADGTSFSIPFVPSTSIPYRNDYGDNTSKVVDSSHTYTTTGSYNVVTGGWGLNEVSSFSINNTLSSSFTYAVKCTPKGLTYISNNCFMGSITEDFDIIANTTLKEFNGNYIQEIESGNIPIELQGKRWSEILNIIKEGGINEEEKFYGAFMGCLGLCSVSFPMCTKIGDAAFMFCGLSTVDSTYFPICSYIGKYAFNTCESLSTVYFPQCKYIGQEAFEGCWSLSTVYFPQCTYVESMAFFECFYIRELYFPLCSYLSTSAFGLCSRTTSIHFPVCAYIGNNAFHGCELLTSISFPQCTYIGKEAFRYCLSLTSISFPQCSYIGTDAFLFCHSLPTVSFPQCNYIDSNAFYGCDLLSSIYLMSSSVCILADFNAFGSTSIWTNKGFIYVPTSLVSAYKSASQWSVFSSRIVGV